MELWRAYDMARRDERVDMLEDDPFKRIPDNGPRVKHVHTQRAPDGTIHFTASSSNPSVNLGQIMSQLWGMAPQQQVRHHHGPIWHFSAEEKRHLALATAAFTFALGLMMAGGMSGLGRMGMSQWLVTILIYMPIMLVSVGPAFLLHEIGHKIVARKHGCWAEFRADPKGLRFGVLLAFILGFLFMAPGAVMVAGVVTRRQNGHIAIAGPLVNLALFLIGIPLGALVLGLTNAYDGSTQELLTASGLNWKAVLISIFEFWLQVNLILGLFNMLPFGPLDGLKVRDWNENAFYTMILIFAIPVATMIFGIWNPASLLESLATLL